MGHNQYELGQRQNVCDKSKRMGHNQNVWDIDKT